LVVQTGFKGFFGSVIFIIPVLVFFANLSACTVKRFIRELKKRGTHHHGPDILHIGLILLVLGGLWSYSGHQEGSVTLAPGDSVNLPDGSVMSLVDFTFERYPDGRPSDWTSIIDVKKDGKTVVDKAEVRVNKPLRYAGLTFYQASFSNCQPGPGRCKMAGKWSWPRARNGCSAPPPTSSWPRSRRQLPACLVLRQMPVRLDAAGQSGRAILRVTPAMGETRTMRAAPGDQVGDLKVGYQSPACHRHPGG
jgi:hypothetical protein